MTSLALIFIGEVIFGVAAIVYGADAKAGTIAIIMLLISKVLTGFHFIVE